MCTKNILIDISDIMAVPFRLITDPLSEVVEQLAAKELRETPEIRETALKELRELLAQDPEIFYDDTDYYLLIFLRPCHFYPESAHKLVSYN